MITGFVWVVPALILRWIDGDTCEVKLDQGWRLSRERQSIRLLNLYAPELGEPGGLEAKAHAESLAPPGSVVVLHSKAIGKTSLWGTAQESLSRTLGDIRLQDGRDFATVMVADGFGVHG